MTLLPGQPVTVSRLKHRRNDLVYPMVAVYDDGDHMVVGGPYSDTTSLDLGYVVFEPSDHFVEHFWRSQWYSVAAVANRMGHAKGWYCDVTRPATVSNAQIVSIDLELDVWVPADSGPVLGLDEDEFNTRELDVIDPEAHRRAQQAYESLRRSPRSFFTSLPAVDPAT